GLVVPPSKLHRLGVAVQVVVAVRKPETALIRRADHLGRVPEILLGAKRKQRGHAAEVQRGDCSGEALTVRDRIDPREFLPERLRRRRLRLLLVHARGIEVPELPSLLVSGLEMSRRVGLQALAEDREIALRDLGEAPRPCRPIRRDGGSGSPAATGEVVEVSARVDGPIERLWIDACRDGGRRWARRDGPPHRAAAQGGHEVKTRGGVSYGCPGLPGSGGSHDRAWRSGGFPRAPPPALCHRRPPGSATRPARARSRLTSRARAISGGRGELMAVIARRPTPRPCGGSSR